MKGTIKNINIDGGFGFVRGDDKVDRFFHKTRVARGVNFNTLQKDDVVEFEEDDDGPKGPRAKNIELA